MWRSRTTSNLGFGEYDPAAGYALVPQYSVKCIPGTLMASCLFWHSQIMSLVFSQNRPCTCRSLLGLERDLQCERDNQAVFDWCFRRASISSLRSALILTRAKSKGLLLQL
jgi:hypothetical protein